MVQFEKVHPRFFEIIRSQFPDLTQHDLRLCAYVKVGMDNKEIAQISNITDNAVRKSLYRMKKRMQLDPETELRGYLLDL